MSAGDHSTACVVPSNSTSNPRVDFTGMKFRQRLPKCYLCVQLGPCRCGTSGHDVPPHSGHGMAQRRASIKRQVHDDAVECCCECCPPPTCVGSCLCPESAIDCSTARLFKRCCDNSDYFCSAPHPPTRLAMRASKPRSVLTSSTSLLKAAMSCEMTMSLLLLLVLWALRVCLL